MAALSKGQNPGPESSIMKNFGADIGQRLTELAIEAMGFYIAPDQPQARAAGQNVPAIGTADGVMVFPRYFNLRARFDRTRAYQTARQPATRGWPNTTG